MPLRFYFWWDDLPLLLEMMILIRCKGRNPWGHRETGHFYRLPWFVFTGKNGNIIRVGF